MSVIEFWTHHLSTPRSTSSGELLFDCPFCDDTKGHYYVSQETTQYHCKKCNAKGNAITFLKEIPKLSGPEIHRELERFGIAEDSRPVSAKKDKAVIPNEDVIDREPLEHYRKLTSDTSLSKLGEERGIPLDTLKKYVLWDGKEWRIPIWTPDGHLTDLRRRRPGQGQKNISAKDAKVGIFAVEKLRTNDDVWVAEGEWDGMMLESKGYAASAVCGQGQLPSAYAKLFKGKQVTFVYDLDKNGKGEEGMLGDIEKVKPYAASIRMVQWPKHFLDGRDSYDVSDHFNRGGIKEELESFLVDVDMGDMPSDGEAVRPVSISQVREMVMEHFPEIWTETEACLSVVATLMLKDIQNPVGLNLIGPPSSQKTTIFGFLPEIREITFRCDSFTPRSFVSHSANTKKDDLKKIDLLPQMRHRVFIVPELAPMFGKREEDLLENISILTRVFDGEGLQSASGVYGRRGYTGDYLFAWLGATTPIEPRVWRVMGKLGSRWLFLRMGEKDDSPEKDRLALTGEVCYRDKVTQCREVVGPFLRCLWDTHGGARGVDWDRGKDPDEVTHLIVQFGRVVCRLRGTVSVWSVGKEDDSTLHYSVPMVEESPRINSLLYSLARGHALIHGRTQLTMDDLPVVGRVALSSGPDDRCRILQQAVKNGGTIDSPDAEHLLGCSRPTARKLLNILAILGLGDIDDPGGSAASTLKLGEEFAWLWRDATRQLPGFDQGVPF